MHSYKLSITFTFSQVKAKAFLQNKSEGVSFSQIYLTNLCQILYAQLCPPRKNRDQVGKGHWRLHGGCICIFLYILNSKNNKYSYRREFIELPLYADSDQPLVNWFSLNYTNVRQGSPFLKPQFCYLHNEVVAIRNLRVPSSFSILLV